MQESQLLHRQQPRELMLYKCDCVTAEANSMHATLHFGLLAARWVTPTASHMLFLMASVIASCAEHLGGFCI